MHQTEFVNLVTCHVAGVLSKELYATHVTHNFTNNLLNQIATIHNNNPNLDTFQVLSLMYAEDAEANLFAVAFDELQGPGKELLGINFKHTDGSPKVTAIMIGKTM